MSASFATKARRPAPNALRPPTPAQLGRRAIERSIDLSPAQRHEVLTDFDQAQSLRDVAGICLACSGAYAFTDGCGEYCSAGCRDGDRADSREWEAHLRMESPGARRAVT